MESERHEAWEEYIHIISLIIMCLLMFIAAYEVCVSSINDQPKIKYRFTTMLFCFVQLIITLMATIYLYGISESNIKWRHSVALFMRLCGVTGRILGVLCCYSFLLTIVKSLYQTPIYKQKLPRWFKAFTKIFCVLLMSLDIILTIVAFINGTTYAQNIFMLIIEIWVFLFCIALFIALFGALKQNKILLNRSSKMYGNNVMSPKRPSSDKHNKWNPSSSKFNINNISLPKTENILDVDGKSIRSQYLDNKPYKILKKKIFKIQLMIFFNFIVLIMLVIGAWYLFETKLYKIMKNETFPPLTESPMSSIDTYLVYTAFSMIYIISLLWWLYIPKSLCCDNIAIDSLFFFCCTYTLHCCFVLQPSQYIQDIDDENNYNNNNNHNHHEPSNTTDFDFFNFESWRDTFRMTSYREMSLISNNGDTTKEEEEEDDNNNDDDNDDDDDDGSVTFASEGDKDYHDIATNRSPNLPNMKAINGTTSLKNKNISSDQSLELTVRERGTSAFSQPSTRL